MRNMFFATCCLIILAACNKPKEEETAKPVEEVKAIPAREFADEKYAEIGKKNLASLASGDIDGWMSSFADNAKFFWSSGDSLVGKAAITEYWKNRRSKVIDSISFINDIWLPIKINKPQTKFDREGVWLMSWFQVNTKYKNNQSIFMWIHQDSHFDTNDKIDQVVQYIDRAPINAALAKKK